jgi:transcription termination factor Rho
MTTTLERPPTPVTQEQATGVLDITSNGQGHLRAQSLLPGPADLQVSSALIRRHGLRKGDLVEGVRGKQRALTEVERVNGLPAEELRGRPHFRDLTPLHPRERLRLEHPAGGATTRLIDLVAPIGKGQRGLIVAPPKTGKTVLLQQLAAAVAGNHPEAHLMVVLLDERPEEVTDMRRSVRGEVLASTFDQAPKQHIALAELAVERAKRLVEAGQDVVILLDSLTRLCRAHNNAAAAGGRTLSGGVDAAALHGPKRFFGAARLTEEARFAHDHRHRPRGDRLPRRRLLLRGAQEHRQHGAPPRPRLASRRVFPAVDITPSGTRREELLVPAAELGAVRGLRRALLSRGDAQAGLETLLDKLRRTPDNATFLRQVQPTVPAGQ